MSEYQTINEAIAVAGVYDHSSFAPKKFLWRHRAYPIEEVTLVSNVKDGGVRKRLYSVVAKGTVYRLEFNRDTEVWLISEVWFE